MAARIRRRCAKCDEKVGEEEAILVSDQFFHSRCFSCGDCGRRLEAADHFHEAAGGRIVCLRCYAAHSAPRCSVCFAGIVDECVRAGDGFFHSACFVCPDCKQPLKGEFVREADAFLHRECFWQRRLLKFVADSKQKTR